jgi:hypothetical protein
MMTRLRRMVLAAPVLAPVVLAAALFCSTTAVFGADFDGSKRLICATVEVHTCDPGETCLRGLPDDVGVPRFMRIDFSEKTIAGPKRTTPIRYIDSGGDQILMQGTELGYAWTVVLDKTDGSMSMTLVSRDETFAVFGYCIPP